LVVILDVEPIDHGTGLLGDGAVSSVGILGGVGGEPWCNGCVSDEVFTGGEMRTEGVRESDEPILGLACSAVDGREVFIVDVDAVKLAKSISKKFLRRASKRKTHSVLLNEGSDFASKTLRINTISGRLIGRTKDGHHQTDSIGV
jgi:hypothetical protein